MLVTPWDQRVKNNVQYMQVLGTHVLQYCNISSSAYVFSKLTSVNFFLTETKLASTVRDSRNRSSHAWVMLVASSSSLSGTFQKERSAIQT